MRFYNLGVLISYVHLCFGCCLSHLEIMTFLSKARWYVMWPKYFRTTNITVYKPDFFNVQVWYNVIVFFFFFLICRFCKNLIKHIHSYAPSFLFILHRMVHDLQTYIVIEKLCVHRMFNLIACISLYVLHAVSPLSLFHTVTTYVILLGSLKVSQACRLLQSFSYLIIHAVLRWS